MSIVPMKTKSFSGGVMSKDDLALELVTGNDAKGRPSYALLLLLASKVKDLRIALATKDVVLENYGKVMAKGAGHEPPEGLIDDIVELLNEE